MKKVKGYLVAVCAMALLGALLVGCSGQSASSSGSASSGSASAQSTEDMLKEVVAASSEDAFKSVTIDMQGKITVNTDALMTSSSESSGSAPSASASSASADSSTGMTLPISILAKADGSGDQPKMYMTMNMMGQNAEFYVKGEQAVMVVAGQAIGGTLEEFGMQNYASVGTLMRSQNADITALSDAVQSIEKSTEGEDTVYKVTFDPAKLTSLMDSSSTSTYADLFKLTSADAVYRVNAKGIAYEIAMNMKGDGFSSDMDVKLSDFDTTVVPDAPEPSMNVKDVPGLGSGASVASQDAAA